MMELTESTQRDWAALAVQQSKEFTVTDQQSYANAAELCKDIKSRINQITDYWKPLKEAAAKQHKDICAKEKELLTPFSTAETDLKNKMEAWQRQKLEEERQAREEQERRRQEEAELLLKEAAKADTEGNAERSEFLFEAAENVSNMYIPEAKQEKTAGTAAKTVWKARVVNASLVPVSVACAIIRPVDEKVLNDLARASKGNMTIPGVEFYEDIQIAIRSR
jgi:hypothetical protein